MRPSRRAFLRTSSFVIAGISASSPMAAVRSSRSELVGIAQSTVASRGAPGIQVYVAKDGAEQANISAGFMNLETQTLVDPNTIFRVGSLTKQFIGALLIKLNTEGKLKLGDLAAKYLPALAQYDPFTIEELLHHTAGVHNDEESPPLLGPVTQLQLANAISKQKQFFDFPPGTAWQYSNANYILLGAIIETVSRSKLADIATEYITRPLQLSHTGFDDPNQILTGRASGYSHQGEKQRSFNNAVWMDVIQAGGAGAMRSNAADLARWHQALLFGNFLSKQQREIYLAPGRLRDGRLASENRFNEHDSVMGETQYGFGVNLDRSSDQHGLIVHHNGFISGFSSYLATHIPSRTTVACLCNIDANPTLPFRDIRRQVFKAYLPSIKSQ